MADRYLNKSVDFINTNETNIYTVPTSQLSSPPIPPTVTIVKSLLVCNDSGGSVNLDVKIADQSLGPADIVMYKAKAVASNTTIELLTNPLVLEEGDVLKATASGANALHVICSLVEIT